MGETKRKAMSVLTPSPSMPSVQQLSVTTPPQAAQSMEISSSSPNDFSAMQLQTILQKGKTLEKITQMKDIMQSEWKSVSSSPGEYQIFVKPANLVETADTV